MTKDSTVVSFAAKQQEHVLRLAALNIEAEKNSNPHCQDEFTTGERFVVRRYYAELALAYFVLQVAAGIDEGKESSRMVVALKAATSRTDSDAPRLYVEIAELVQDRLAKIPVIEMLRKVNAAD